ncbi:clarin-1 isoform X1 [Pristis pectinata]|uniref:clarin-1 isoform X1 n=1 Tax=Pristis pectinata TaxID=685728 RepID=UPI00223D0B8E|nr:clarin-1 isoform X1 [Pristis pectinata]
MANRQKRVIFCGGALLSLASALTALVALSTHFWVEGSLLCKTGVQLVNASGAELHKFVGAIRYGIFHGQRLRECGLGGRSFQITFFPTLLDAIPASIHVMVLLFSAAVIVFALVAAGFFTFNAFGRPYETLHGPMGLYLWNAIACSCGFMVMILFTSEVKIHHLSEKIANYKEESFVFETYTEMFGYSFWLVFACTMIHCSNILLIRLIGIQFPFSKSKSTNSSDGGVDLMY